MSAWASPEYALAATMADAILGQLVAALVPIEGPQPIRGHEVVNLALEFRGSTPVAGSTYNYQQDLAINQQDLAID